MTLAAPHTRVRTIAHWAGGKAFAGSSDRTAAVTNPATGQVTGQVALADVADARAVIEAAACGLPRLARHLDRQAHHDPLRLPRAAQRPQAGTGRHHHRRARQGALRRARRGQPRPGSRRIRLRHRPSAQGRHDRERIDQRRRRLDPSAARPGGGHLPVQLPGHGADVVLPRRHRRGQHRRAQAVARRTRRPRCGSPTCGPRQACPPASSTCCRATRSPSTSC